MAEEKELTEVEKLLLEATDAINESVVSSLNNIFDTQYEVGGEGELISRLHTELPHVIAMGFANDHYQGMLILSFGDIAILEEYELTDSDLIRDPFGEAANQTVGIFNDNFTKFGHVEQAPPIYLNANATSFPVSPGIMNKLVIPGNESDDIIFGFSIKAV